MAIGPATLRDQSSPVKDGATRSFFPRSGPVARMMFRNMPPSVTAPTKRSPARGGAKSKESNRRRRSP
jgi:hypothetical protein